MLLTAVSIFATVLTAKPGSVSADPGATISNDYCTGGHGAVVVQVNNQFDERMPIWVRLRQHGIYLDYPETSFSVSAESAGSAELSGIPDGTYEILVIWGSRYSDSQAVIAIDTRTFDCQPDHSASIGGAVCSQTRGTGSELTVWITNNRPTSSLYAVTAGNRQVHVAVHPGDTMPYTVDGINGGIHEATVRYNNTTLASRTVDARCPLDTPTVTSAPEAVHPNSHIDLTWTSPSRAGGYQLSITRDGTFLAGDGVNIPPRTVNNSEDSYFVQLEGEYCFRITAVPSSTYRNTDLPSGPSAPVCVTVDNTPIAKPNVTLTLSNDELRFSWNNVGGAQHYQWSMYQQGSLLDSENEVGCCADDFDAAGLSGEFCVRVQPIAPGRRTSGPGEACHYVKQALPTPTFSLSKSVTQVNQIVRHEVTRDTNVAYWEVVRTKDGRWTPSFQMNRHYSNMRLSSVGQICYAARAIPRDLILYRSSGFSEPVCIEVRSGPSTEAQTLAAAHGGRLWDGNHAQIIIEEGLAGQVDSVESFAEALYRAAKRRGMTGSLLATVMGMENWELAPAEYSAIVKAITADAPVDLEVLRDMTADDLGRDDVFDRLIGPAQQAIMADASARFGTETLSDFTARAASRLEADNVSYMFYLQVLVPLGYMNGHQHLVDQRVSAADLLNGVGLVFGSSSTAYTMRSPAASKTLGGLGLAVGGYALISDIASGGFEGDLADGASVLSLFGGGMALFSGPVGGVIFGLVSVIAGIASFLIGSSRPTFDSPIQDVLEYQRDYEAERQRQAQAAAQSRASLEDSAERLRNRISDALFSGNISSSGAYNGYEAVYIVLNGRQVRVGDRFVFDERDHYSGRWYRGIIERVQMPGDSQRTYSAYGLDLAVALGTSTAPTGVCPLGEWNETRRAHCD